MPLKIDCGDVELTLNLVFGVRYKLAAKDEDEQAERAAMIDKAMDIKSNLEKSVLIQLADHIGYDEETIEAKINARDEKNAGEQAAEKQGSEDMRRRRTGR
jgi:hypothetical protein